jgi:hypothetical protein
MVKRCLLNGVLYLLLGVGITMMFGCSKIQEPPKGMSPTETMEYYFEHWDTQNYKQMDTVRHKSVRLNRHGTLLYVKLLSIEEGTGRGEIHYTHNLDAEPYAMSVVKTEFEIAYEEGHGDGFSNGIVYMDYLLIKELKNSDWRIVRWWNPLM